VRVVGSSPRWPEAFPQHGPGHAYPRWFFSNRSADIRALFCEYCERLGIR
jgi:hypothetical protein